MKYPGRPEEPPEWYRDRDQSFIEKQFSDALDDLAKAIEAEHWFGDSEKHSRFRVDFLLKDARLVVELDGHGSHSTKEQLEKDAIRQRYLSRAGYTVVRFTGREVHRDVGQCVSELRNLYQECMHRRPAKFRVMYIDYPFVKREIARTRRLYERLHPEKQLSEVPIDALLPHAIQWLHEKSFVTAFVFHPPEYTEELEPLNGLVTEYEKGEIRINTMPADFYSLELGEHLQSFSHLFDEFYLIGDDPVHVHPMRSVLPKEFSDMKLGSYTYKGLKNGKLLRLGNDETAFVGTDLARVQWQDIAYIIGSAMGLHPHEL